MANDQFESYIEIFRENHGILRAARAIRLGIPEYVIYEMARKGKVVKESRGLYRLAESQPLGNPDFIQVNLLIPKGVLFLISALYFHKLTTQIPHYVYVALPQSIKKTRMIYPPVKFFYRSDRQYLAGIQEYIIDGIAVRIYDKEKTITDCFMYRKQIGGDIALEALKDYMHQPSPNTHLLMEYARINRVEKLMRPYVEILV
ncbi:MAG: type IV toxin-antitoxin system AbiEi family antitoxin domain-containing protein [Anaerolineaceae bacterium]|nr:type IV toxin-antitoxin system AbiEi family antitoxin domain-containing protein [Anaerolineaceae bacterium]